MKLLVDISYCVLGWFLISCDLCNAIEFAVEPDWSPYIIDLQSVSSKTLECSTRQSALDGVYMKWLKNGKPIPKKSYWKLVDDNRRLVFTFLAVEDSGTYTCVAYDLRGNYINFTRSLRIVDNSPKTVPPTVIEVDHSPVIVKPGESRNISCLFYQGDSPLNWKEWAWFHNDVRLQDSDKYFTYPEPVVDHGKYYSRLHLRINHTTYADLGTYTCLGVNYFGNATGNITLDFPRKEFPLLMTVGLASGGTCFLLFVAIGIIGALKYRRCREYQEMHFGDDPDKYDFPRGPPLHDVFIAYSSKDDEIWVREELLRHLEERGYDVYVHFKDFTPGERILDNIKHGVYLSQKILVLLSKNFLTSGYCELELEAADNKRFLMRKDGLIVIKFDDCLVPEKFRKKTFLDWTDPKVKPHFWQRLFKAIGTPLSKKRKENTGDNDDKLNQDEKVEDVNENIPTELENNIEDVFEGQNNNLQWRQNMNHAAPAIRRQAVNSTTSEDRQLIDDDLLGYDYEPCINATQQINNHHVLII